MEPVTIGMLGLLGMFVLIALHVPIGIAMGLTGLIGVGLIIGFGPAVTLLGTEPSAAMSNPGLATLAMFLLMGSFAASGAYPVRLSTRLCVCRSLQRRIGDGHHWWLCWLSRCAAPRSRQPPQCRVSHSLRC